jgi:hypothetical protein
MTNDRTLRAYLLGELSADDRAALELQYFAQSDVVDRLCEAEDDLIDAYLTHRLADDERERFDRSYLASPGHRTRVAIARALTASSDGDDRHARERQRRSLTIGPLALAAAVVLVVGASVWWFRASGPANALPGAKQPGTSPSAASDTPPTPVVIRPATAFAVTLAPISVRGASDSVSVSIPSGTELVFLNLLGDAATPSLTRPQAVLRTVEGAEVWRGVATSAGVSAPTIARVEVPAARLVPGDYLAELIDAGPGGRPIDRFQYFLRVRK